MKRVLILVLASVLLLSSAGAEQFLLPTPPPAATLAPASETFVLPGDEEAEMPVGDLPDPSYQLRTTGETYEAFFTMGEAVLDARIYPVANVGNAISDYLTACTGAGYKWELSDVFTGYLAYRIFGGGFSAFFLPDYGGKVLLLIQQGMPAQEQMPEPEAYEQNKLLVNINGTVFQTDFLKNYSFMSYSGRSLNVVRGSSGSYFLNGVNLVFYSPNAPYRVVGLTFPATVRTAEMYTLSRANPDDIGFGLFERLVLEGESNLGHADTAGSIVFAGKNKWDRFKIGLEADSDYLTLQMVYVNGNEYRGRFEGVLCDGTIRISGTFWVVN